MVIPVDHRVKIKESEKKNKYLDLARGLKIKRWNVKVTVISIETGELELVPNGLVRGQENFTIGGRA